MNDIMWMENTCSSNNATNKIHGYIEPGLSCNAATCNG